MAASMIDSDDLQKIVNRLKIVPKYRFGENNRCNRYFSSLSVWFTFLYTHPYFECKNEQKRFAKKDRRLTQNSSKVENLLHTILTSTVYEWFIFLHTYTFAFWQQKRTKTICKQNRPKESTWRKQLTKQLFWLELYFFTLVTISKNNYRSPGNRSRALYEQKTILKIVTLAAIGCKLIFYARRTTDSSYLRKKIVKRKTVSIKSSFSQLLRVIHISTGLHHRN